MLNSTHSSAEPGPGDIFREYLWNGPFVNAGNWQRVTDPDATAGGAKEFLPNPVNAISLDDLEGAVRAEVYIEQWGGHAGSSGKSLRLNGGDWIPVPEPAGIPNGAGTHQRPECYQYFTYPSVSVPLEQLREGENSFEFNCDRQICFNFGWGQWGVYGVTFRVYYGDDKPHAIGRVTSPTPGTVFGDTLRVVLESDDDDVESVDFIGLYEDFDYEGNGIWRQWHYHYRYGEIRQHLGTATEAPYAVTWRTDWVPDQEEPVQVAARIRNREGIFYITQPVGDLTLDRPGRSVWLYKPFDVPGSWQTRANNIHRCKVFVVEDLSRATAAKMILTTWSGGHADAIGINDTMVVKRVGWTHDYSYDEVDVPLERLLPGTNEFYTFAKTVHHGIEVLWPGIVLKVQYAGSREEVQVKVPARDEQVYADRLSERWSVGELPPQLFHDTRVELASSEQAFEGETALAVESPERFWAVKLDRDFPLAITQYRALRFAFLAGDVEVPDHSVSKLSGWFLLYLNEKHRVVLMNAETDRVDMSLPSWQIVEVPLDSLDWERPYLESLRLYGDFTGSFFIDDIRLVLREESTAVTAAEARALPPAARLLPNYPNPFNSGTVIRFSLPASGAVELAIFDLVGQRVAALTRGVRQAGTHAVRWDGRDEAGRALASGVYLCRLRTGDAREETRKLLLVR